MCPQTPHKREVQYPREADELSDGPGKDQPARLEICDYTTKLHNYSLIALLLSWYCCCYGHHLGIATQSKNLVPIAHFINNRQ